MRQLSGAVEQGRLEAQEAAAGREEAERRLLEAHAQLEEGSLRLEQLSGQLLSQRHQRDRGEGSSPVSITSNQMKSIKSAH